MNSRLNLTLTAIIAVFILSCSSQGNKEEAMQSEKKIITAKEILGNPDYLAISYGGYRQKTRDIQPTVDQLKEDLKILHAMGIRLLRTYNVQEDKPHASNVLKAISELKQEHSDF